MSVFTLITKGTFVYLKSKINWCYCFGLIFTVLFIGAAPAEASSRVRTSSTGSFAPGSLGL